MFFQWRQSEEPKGPTRTAFEEKLEERLDDINGTYYDVKDTLDELADKVEQVFKILCITLIAVIVHITCNTINWLFL